ncbi:RNase H family protein [Novosphingobium sp.]|uniref:RNase H family protein n=1 Tax=Novosphingobium sp. TaxID=1874826 RepID=UPI003B522A21
MTHVEIFVGSQCHGNPGPGGWATVLRVGRHEKVLSGAEPRATLNSLELQAFTEALRILIEPCAISVHSANRFLADGFARWSGLWTPRGWAETGKRPIHNADQWYALIALAQVHEVTFVAMAGEESPAMAHAMQLAATQ